ncbi:hypothetical protein EKO27_g8660 [Xylaria grammica]|uniref:Uncharacterized protein n=1 Tax=Xylaria grammica TaxID=363999 RepID=A0A439CW83_9PEZI|nr:hypothetical protein EKO27_g8660 [Xylaria grammica]
MASFDFKSYLKLADLACSYDVAKLSGGLVNLTVRASKTAGRGLGNFSGARSLILKSAPPFVAAVGLARAIASDIRKALTVTEAFVRGVCMGYTEVSKPPFTSDATARRLRSTVILFGRENINQAYEAEWYLEGYAISRVGLRNKMVMAGADYSRKAGKDVSEALEIWSNHTEEKGTTSMLFALP